MNLYEIIPGKLWQSGILGEFTAPQVDCIIDCTHDMDLRGLGVGLYIHTPFDDKPLDLPTDNDLLLQLEQIADVGDTMLGLGKKVLVHCTAGINRSSLMNGMILHHYLASPGDLVEYIRMRRPGALTNESFAKYLQAYNH